MFVNKYHLKSLKFDISVMNVTSKNLVKAISM